MCESGRGRDLRSGGDGLDLGNNASSGQHLLGGMNSKVPLPPLSGQTGPLFAMRKCSTRLLKLTPNKSPPLLLPLLLLPIVGALFPPPVPSSSCTHLAPTRQKHNKLKTKPAQILNFEPSSTAQRHPNRLGIQAQSSLHPWT